MYVQKYSFNTADPVMRVLWDELCSRKIVEGVHCTILPASIPTADRLEYNLVPMGHYRLDLNGGRILYDWVLYDDPAKVVFRGYFLTLWEFTGATVPKGGGFDAYPEQRPIAPLPAPLLGWVPEELPEPSRTAQAIEWLKAEPGRTQAEAARLFGITSAGICVAAKAAGLVQSRAPSRTAQAIEWLKAEPGRTQAEAARLFGVYPSNISAELARHRNT